MDNREIFACLKSQSVSEREIILTFQDLLHAIDLLEQNGVRILGWEGVIRDVDGNLGHGDAPQGTASLEKLTVPEAAQLCRQTIQESFDEWIEAHPNTKDELLFCLVIED